MHKGFSTKWGCPHIDTTNETYTKAPVRNGINNIGTHVDTTVTRDWYVIFYKIYDQDTYTKTLVRNGVIPM